MSCVTSARPGSLGGHGDRVRSAASSTRLNQAIGLVLVLIISLLCVPSGYAQTAGTTEAVEGTTQLRPAEATDFAPLSRGDPANVGDVVETEKESKCYIRLIDESDNSLGESTSYNVNDLEEVDGITFFNGWLDKGIARFRKKLPPTNPPSTYVITTPTAVIMVEPGEELTDFVVDILNTGQTYVAVLSGVITVKNISEDIPEEQKVRACQGVYVDQEKPPTKPHGVPPEEYRRLIEATTIPGTLPEDVPICETQPDWIHYDCPCPPGFAEDPFTGDCLPCAECSYYDWETCSCYCCPFGQVWDEFLGGCTPICSSLTPVPTAPSPVPGTLPADGCPCCDCCPDLNVPPCFAASPGPPGGPNPCPGPGPGQQVPCAPCTNPGVNVLPPAVSGLPCALCCECDAFGCGINLLPPPGNGPDFFGCGFPDGGWCISPGTCAARGGLWRARTFIPGWPCFMCIPNIPCWTLNPPLWRDGLTRMAQSKRLDPSDDPFPGFFFSARIRPAVAILMTSDAVDAAPLGRTAKVTGTAAMRAALDEGAKRSQAKAGKVVKACCSKAAKMLACPPCRKPTYRKGKLECVPADDGTPCSEGGVCKECKGGKCVDLPACPEGRVRRVTTRVKSKPPTGGAVPKKSEVKAPKGKAGKSRRAYLKYFCECVDVKEKCETHQKCREKLKDPNACCMQGECIVQECPPGHRLDPETCNCIPPPPPPLGRCRSHEKCKRLLQDENACCDEATGKCFVKECPPGHRLDPETCRCIPPPPPPPPRCRSHRECKRILQDENACCDWRRGKCFRKDCPPHHRLDPRTCECVHDVAPCRNHSDCRRFEGTSCCDENTHQCRPMIRCPDGTFRCECRDEACRSHAECMRKTRGRLPCCIDGTCGPKRKCRVGPPSCECEDHGCPPDNARKIRRCVRQGGTPEVDRSGCFQRCKPGHGGECPRDNSSKIARCKARGGTPELDRSGCFQRCKPGHGGECPRDNSSKIARCKARGGTPELDRSGCFQRCKPGHGGECPRDNSSKIARCKARGGTPELDRSGCFRRCKPGHGGECPRDNSSKIARCKARGGTPELDRSGCFLRCKPGHGGECPRDNSSKIARCKARGGSPELDRSGCFLRCKPGHGGECPRDNSSKIARCKARGGTPELDRRGCFQQCRRDQQDPCAQCRERGMDCKRVGRGRVQCVPRGGSGSDGGDPCAQCRERGMDCKRVGRGRVQCVPRGGSGSDGGDPCAQCRERGMNCQQLGGGRVRCVPRGGSGSGGGDPCAQCRERGMNCQQLGGGRVRCVPRRPERPQRDPRVRTPERTQQPWPNLFQPPR